MARALIQGFIEIAGGIRAANQYAATGKNVGIIRIVLAHQGQGHGNDVARIRTREPAQQVTAGQEGALADEGLGNVRVPLATLQSTKRPATHGAAKNDEVIGVERNDVASAQGNGGRVIRIVTDDIVRGQEVGREHIVRGPGDPPGKARGVRGVITNPNDIGRLGPREGQHA